MIQLKKCNVFNHTDIYDKSKDNSKLVLFDTF